MTQRHESPRSWHAYLVLILLAGLPAAISYDQGAMLLGEPSRWTGDTVFDAANFAGALWDIFVYVILSVPLVVGYWRRRRWALALGLFLYGGEFAFCVLTAGQVAYLMHRGYEPTGYQVTLGTAMALMIVGAAIVGGIGVYLWWQRDVLFSREPNAT